MQQINELSRVLKDLNEKEIVQLLQELLTGSEIETLSKRWRIFKMLSAHYTQRQISKELKVSLCKVTRGAKMLKKSNSIVDKIIKKGGFNEKRTIN